MYCHVILRIWQIFTWLGVYVTWLQVSEWSCRCGSSLWGRSTLTTQPEDKQSLWTVPIERIAAPLLCHTLFKLFLLLCRDNSNMELFYPPQNPSRVVPKWSPGDADLNGTTLNHITLLPIEMFHFSFPRSNKVDPKSNHFRAARLGVGF